MKGKKVVLRYREEMVFGGQSIHSLNFIVVDVDSKDVDIVQPTGNLEHGFVCDRLEHHRIGIHRTETLGSVVKKLKNLVAELEAEMGI